MKQFETLHNLDDHATRIEFDAAIDLLANCKSLGLNETPPEACENLDKDNLLILFKFILTFWNNESYFE